MRLALEQTENAFDIIAKNRKNINSVLGYRAVEAYTQSLPQKLQKELKKGREEAMSLKALQEIMDLEINHSPNWNDVFQLFEPKNKSMQKETLLHIIKKLNPYGAVFKGDLQAVTKALDTNGDGLITSDDLERKCGIQSL